MIAIELTRNCLVNAQAHEAGDQLQVPADISLEDARTLVKHGRATYTTEQAQAVVAAGALPIEPGAPGVIPERVHRVEALGAVEAPEAELLKAAEQAQPVVVTPDTIARPVDEQPVTLSEPTVKPTVKPAGKASR